MPSLNSRVSGFLEMGKIPPVEKSEMSTDYPQRELQAANTHLKRRALDFLFRKRGTNSELHCAEREFLKSFF